MQFTSLADLVRLRAQEMADRPALIDEKRSVTWSEFDSAASRVATSLIKSGVHPGDRVGILDKNSIEFFEVMFGASKANAVPVPLNWRLAVGELARVLDNAQLSIIFVAAEFVEPVTAATASLDEAPRIVVIGDEATAVGEGYLGWRDRSPARDPLLPADSDIATVILYTSGTTSIPKGAILDPVVFDTLLEGNARTWGYRPGSVNLMTLPGFHAGGTVWTLVAMWRGAATITVRDANPAIILQAIERHRVTHVALVPTLLQSVLDSPGAESADLSSLEFLAYGASPMPADLLTRTIDKLGCRISQMYGVTETAGGVFELPAEDHTRDMIGSPRLRSAGRAQPWVEYRIVDPESRADVPQGELGEVWVRTGQAMRGYWRNPEATAERITEDGWVRTGDLGYADPDHYVFLKSRLQDLIVTGGENVFPAEVETALLTHPEVVSAAVTAIDDARWVESVGAAVVTTPGSRLTDHELAEYARGLLAGYKVPRHIAFVEGLPVNGMGKVLRHQVRAMLESRPVSARS